MERKEIKLEKTTVRERGAAIPLGPLILEMPEGPALAHDAISATVMVIDHETMGKLVLIVSAADIDERRVATMVQLTPDEARSLAASMTHSANVCDGGGETN